MKFKTIFILSAMSVDLASCGQEKSTTENPDNPTSVEGRSSTEEYLPQMRAAAVRLGGDLKQRLVSTIQDQGHIVAIGVCAEEAPQISRSISAQTGLRVRRTALRTRNPENAPDQWETEQLERFSQKIAGGADPATLEAWTIISRDGEKQVRWMKPIITGAPCLACHGEAVAPELRAAIDERYPGDMATGFGLGDLRGAFTVARPLD